MSETTKPTCTCQARIQAEIQTTPSGGHDHVDEVLGLLRVARSQRDDAERMLAAMKPSPNTILAGPGHTPNTSLPPLGDGPKRKMFVEIEVAEDFEKRLDNQWMVEQEIHADRWSWRWQDNLPARPRIVCLVGSSRFCDIAAVERWKLEKQGVLVLAMNLLPEWYVEQTGKTGPDHIAEQEGVAHILDELHLRKIDLADEVFVINVPLPGAANGYIGERTKFEIAYARKLNKPVRYLNPIS
jgi:hypothetical protein